MSESQFEGISSSQDREVQVPASHKAYKSFDAFMNKVYSLMGLGLFVSFITAMAAAYLLPDIATNGWVIGLAVVVQLILVVAISAKLSDERGTQGATGMFYAYSVVSGLTLSVVFMNYAPNAVGAALFSTAGIFAGMSAFGTLTKRNLTGIAKYLLMMVFGIIVASVVNIFVMNSMVNFIISVVTVVVFTILTAVDTQKMKMIYEQYEGSQDNLAVYGALTLYLDFINIFLSLLRIFANSNDN